MRAFRLMAAAAAVAVLGATAALAATAFDDVPEGVFYDEPTAWAVEQGLTVGCNRAPGQAVSDTFCPLANVTRGENITFTYRHQTLVIDPLLDDIRDDVAAAQATADDAETDAAAALVAAAAAQATADDDADTLGGLSCGATQVAIDDGGWRCATVELEWGVFGGFGAYSLPGTDPQNNGGGAVLYRDDADPLILTEADDSTLTPTLFTCGDPACSSSTGRALVSDGISRLWPTGAIGADGRPLIVFYHDDEGDLELYRCADADCTDGTIDKLLTENDTTNDVGAYPEIAIGAGGKPLFTYYAGGGGLNLYACTDTACSSGINRELRSEISAAKSPLAIGQNGNPLIVYKRFLSVRLAVCNDATCSSHDTRDLGTYTGSSNGGLSVVVPSSGLPLVAWNDGTDLVFYSCANTICSSGTQHRVSDREGRFAGILSNGNPVLFGFEEPDIASLLLCTDPRCLAVHTEEIYGPLPGGNIFAGGVSGDGLVHLIGDDATTGQVIAVQLAATGIAIG